MEEGLLLLKEEREERRRWVWGEVGEEVKRLGWIAAPMVVTLSQYLLQVVSTMMVGHLGELSLSSSAIAVSLAAVSGFSLLVSRQCWWSTQISASKACRESRKQNDLFSDFPSVSSIPSDQWLCGFNVEELSSTPNLRSYNYYSDDQHYGLCHKKKRVNGENFGLSPPINGCDFLGLNLRNKRIVDGENHDLDIGALGYGGGNVDQVKKEP